jgi:uncharacterized protein
VLIAVVAADHDEIADAWMAGLEESFATCPIEQGALLRLLLRHGTTAEQGVKVLSGLTSQPAHECWPDELRYGDVSLAGVMGHRQVTDAYLAALARRRRGLLATFDGGLAALHADATVLLPRS